MTGLVAHKVVARDPVADVYGIMPLDTASPA